MATHKVYVYGTLRPFDTTPEEYEGWMYDLGWYPGVILQPGSKFFAEVIEVDDKELKRFDDYEGYDEEDLEGSLYVRRPFRDGWIYEYNRRVAEHQHIPGGDWAEVRRND